MASFSQRLRLAQALELLETAHKLLGPSGKNWTKGTSRKTLRQARPARKASGYVSAGYNRQTGAWEHAKYQQPAQPAVEAEYAYCMTGALEKASTDLGVNGEARSLAETLLRKQQSLQSVPSFNDHPKTTFGDVNEVFTRAQRDAKVDLTKAL